MSKLTFYFFLVVILFSSCRDNLDEMSVEIIEEPPIVYVESSIKGKVVNELGLPFPNVEIQLADNFTTSNATGNFQFDGISVNEQGTIVSATVDGYFKGISHSTFSADGSSFIEIRMMKKGEPDLVDPTAEQSIIKSSGLKIEIPANSIVSSDGSVYTGPVNVFSQWIDPTSENIGAIMPGALIAQDANGNERVLATYGMVTINLETMFGESLEISSDGTLKVEMPIPDELLSTAPDVIEFWEYDLEEGQWLENGTCDKENDFYVCFIPTTGTWNCDVPLEAICLSGQIFDADSSHASYLNVTIKDLTNNFIYWGYTDLLGSFCGSVPRSAPLEITIKDHCDNVVYTDEIGPFEDDFELVNIYLEDNIAEFLINVQGAIEHCQNTEILVGHLAVRYPGTLKIYPITDDGNLDINIALKCTDFPTIELTAFSTIEIASTLTTVVETSDVVDLGLQTTCESLIDSFALLVDGIELVTSPTQYYFKPNQTTNWLVLEGLSGAGTFTIEVGDYQGIGSYAVNTFFTSEDNNMLPPFDLLDATSPDLLVNVTADDGEYIEGNYTGTAKDDISNEKTISGDFKIKKAP